MKTTTLAEICTNVSYGYTASAESNADGVKFLRITDIQGGVVNWKTVPSCQISQSDTEKYLLHDGDIVIARTGNSTGENFIFHGEKQAVYASYLIRFRPDKKIADPDFVWFSMRAKSWWDFVNSVKTGSAQAGANAQVLGKYPLALPEISIQREIAKRLKTIYDKIELNNQMHETLESMAKAIFKEWFIDFGPVRAKAEGRKPFGMDDETAALFPDSFEDSELGMIPKGWRVTSLKEIASYVSRGISPKYIENEGIRVFNQKCVRNGIVLNEPSRFHDLNARSVDGRLLEHLDILINSTGTGTLGRVGQIWQPEKSIVDSHITIVRSNPAVYSALLLGLYCRIREPEIEALGEGSTGQTELSRSRLSELQFIVPSMEIQVAADRIIGPFMEKKYSTLAETQTLISVRDLLLPKLISGQIVLNEASVD